MRLAALIAPALLAASPLAAWEFTPDPVCTLRHTEGAASVVVTFDPRAAEPYAIAVTRPEPWPVEPVFAMRFDGPRGLTIVTSRHALSPHGRVLRVTDRGFGNVLDGLEFNATATAILGGAEVSFPLLGEAPAAPAVRAFRACTEAPVA